MSILRHLYMYMANLSPAEEIFPHDTAEYRSLSDKIGEERKYFEKVLSAEDKERFQEWDKMIFRYEDMTEYSNFERGFRLGAMLVSEIFLGNACLYLCFFEFRL